MSTQITVRLPDNLVEMVDALVSAGEARSRASVVERALQLELRRRLAERDIEILQGAASEDPDDLAGLVRWSQARSRADLD